MGAYATDYVEKTGPPTTPAEAAPTITREKREEIARATPAAISGTICARAGISYRSYGEFVAIRDVKPGGGGEADLEP
jgi:hypothetical protein